MELTITPDHVVPPILVNTMLPPVIGVVLMTTLLVSLWWSKTSSVIAPAVTALIGLLTICFAISYASSQLEGREHSIRSLKLNREDDIDCGGN